MRPRTLDRTKAHAAEMIQHWPRARNDNPERMTVAETQAALARALSLPVDSRRFAVRRREQ